MVFMTLLGILCWLLVHGGPKMADHLAPTAEERAEILAALRDLESSGTGIFGTVPMIRQPSTCSHSCTSTPPPCNRSSSSRSMSRSPSRRATNLDHDKTNQKTVNSDKKEAYQAEQGKSSTSTSSATRPTSSRATSESTKSSTTNTNAGQTRRSQLVLHNMQIHMRRRAT